MRSFMGPIDRLSFISSALFKRLNKRLKALGSWAPTYISYLPIPSNLAHLLTSPRHVRNITVLKPSILHPCPQLSPHLLIPCLPSESSSLPIPQFRVSRLVQSGHSPLDQLWDLTLVQVRSVPHLLPPVYALYTTHFVKTCH